MLATPRSGGSVTGAPAMAFIEGSMRISSAWARPGRSGNTLTHTAWGVAAMSGLTELPAGRGILAVTRSLSGSILETTPEQQDRLTERATLPAGDYAARGEDGVILAAVERKSLENLATTLSDGTLAFQMQRLAELPLSAVVVEGRYPSAAGLSARAGRLAR